MDLRDFYFTKYNDHFFSPTHDLPAWFPIFTLLEAIYHLPLTLWAIPALLRNDPRIPLALLVFGLETSLTTLVCLAEMLSWDDMSSMQRGLQGLGGMYGGYLAVGIFMTLDCYARLDGQIAARHRDLEPVSKKKL